MLTSHNMTLI